jgi:Fic family protein
MDITAFIPGFPGRLWEFSVEDGRDWAFIPTPLATDWEVSQEIWALLVQAREELARLDGIGRFMPNFNLLLRPLQRREALRSSSLEGTYATPQQLLLFEIDPKEPRSIHAPESSWQEVWNYNKALELGIKLLSERPLTLNLIRAMHQELLAGVRGERKDPGNFRRSQVHIGSDKRFIPPPPHEVMPCLDAFEKAIHKANNIDPLIFCFMAHYQFEAIHPFLDGNGRVGRLLLSLMIYENCKLSRPWLYLSAFFDKYKEEYMTHLFHVSTHGNWQDWVKFCLRGTIEQSKDAVRRFDALLTLQTQYRERLVKSGGHIRLTQLIDHLFESPAITIPQLATMCSISYPTARADIERLTSIGILIESDMVERPKIYFASEILDIAFNDQP